MPSTDDSADRHGIRDLCARYAIALDTRDWDGLRSVFTEDATMTFAHVGEVHGVVAIGETCRVSLNTLDSSQHLIGTILPSVDENTARCTSYFQAQHVRSGLEGGDTLLVGGRYDDELEHHDVGWRITRRFQSIAWTIGNQHVVL